VPCAGREAGMAAVLEATPPLINFPVPEFAN
jgi:hypothetical protein